MGLSGAFKCTLKVGLYFLVFATIITFFPGLPPYHLEFESYSITPGIQREGKWPLNNVLDKAEAIISNGDGGIKVVGPESMAVAKDETVYTGVESGDILQFKNGKLSVLSPAPHKCERFEQWICGRPLGLRLFKNQLYVIDAYHGIYKVDMKTGERESLFRIDEPIDGKVALLPDDLDITEDSFIYWSDASTNGDYISAVNEFLSGASGRLIRFDPLTKKNQVLIDNVHFANGVQLSEKQDFVLVAELIRARILRYYLKGPKAGTVDVLLMDYPGFQTTSGRMKKGDF